MSQTLSLESFDGGLVQDDQPGTAFNLGFEDGFAAGEAAAKANAAALNDTLVQAVADAEFTFAEARGQVLRSLAPLFAAVVDKVLPHCIATGFAGHLADLLIQAAADDLGAQLELHVHPENTEAVEAALADLPNAVIVLPDKSLTPHAAWIKRSNGDTLLDADALLSEICAALSTIQHPADRTQSHG